MSETTIIISLIGALIGTIVGFVLRIRKMRCELAYMRGQVWELTRIINEKDKMIKEYSELTHELTDRFDGVIQSHEDFLKEMGIEV